MVQYRAEGLGIDFHRGGELISYNKEEGSEVGENLYTSEITGSQIRVIFHRLTNINPTRNIESREI